MINIFDISKTTKIAVTMARGIKKNNRVTVKNQKQETAVYGVSINQNSFCQKTTHSPPPLYRTQDWRRLFARVDFFRPSGSSIKLELGMWPAHRDHKKSRVESFLYKIVYVTYRRKNKFQADNWVKQSDWRRIQYIKKRLSYTSVYICFEYQ